MTRKEYLRKFEKIKNETWCYIPRAGEEIVQIEECDYYFYSNEGYMYSVYGKDIRPLKATLTGKKGTKKDGTKKRQDWAWKPSTGKSLKMTAMAAKYFPNKFETEAYIDLPEEQYQNHHINCNASEMELPASVMNRAADIQRVPEVVHEHMTKIQRKTVDQILQEDNVPKEVPHYYVTSWEDFFASGKILVQPYMEVFDFDTESGHCKRAYAQNVNGEELLNNIK